MIPIVSLTGGKVVMKAQERLMRRPLEPLAKAMGQLGVRVTHDGGLVDVEGGPPKGGSIRIRGDVSSQFISGLLFAGPLLKDGLGLELTSPLESRHYVTLTMETMKQHGIKVQSNKKMSHFKILPSQRYCPAPHRISGDYSSAAFALSAAAITNSKVLVRNLTRTKAEPDAVLIEILSQMGAEATIVEDGVLVNGGRLKATDINLRDSPDLGPVTAVLGCYAEGETRISGAARLRYKESDRLAAITSELSSLGASIIETEDGLILRGPSNLSGGIVRSHGDHRIAMALSVAALGANGNVVIEDAECVSKSYPNFFDDLRSLGVGIVG
jgi:3-phosphoshikimate 1-carboxyvinyltransferase